MTEARTGDVPIPAPVRTGKSAVSPMLVLAYGNPSRGDDALGPMLLERLAGRCETAGGSGVELIGDFQLQIEHALDIQDRELVLFADASTACRPPFELEEIGPRRDASVTSHAMSPQAVLAVCRDVLGKSPPPSFLLSVRGESFQLGTPLSAAACRHLHAAVELTAAICARPEAAYWRARARLR